MHGHQGHRLLTGEVCRVQLLRRLLFHGVEVFQECDQRGAALERAPLLGEVEQAVEIEPGGQSLVGRQRLHVLPGPGPVEDQTADLHQAHALALGEYLPVDGEEVGERGDRLRAKTLDLLEVLDRLQKRDARDMIGVPVGVTARKPPGEGGDVGEPESIAAPEEDLHQ